jgi:hypothetical protein
MTRVRLMSSNSETQHITSMKKHACKWMRTVFLKAQMLPEMAVCVLWILEPHAVLRYKRRVDATNYTSG